jgi:hypothetical protein
MSNSGNPTSAADIDRLEEQIKSMNRAGHPLSEEMQALIKSAMKERSEKDIKKKSKKKRNKKA